MVSYETLLNYPGWTIIFTVHTYDYDKQLGAVISHNNKPILFFSMRLIKLQHNYTMTDKELLSIVECLKQLQVILLGYEINVFSYHKNLVYAATLSESQRVIRLWLIIKEFGPNIQHISGVEKIIDDTINRLPSASINKYDPITMKD